MEHKIKSVLCFTTMCNRCISFVISKIYKKFTFIYIGIYIYIFPKSWFLAIHQHWAYSERCIKEKKKLKWPTAQER